MQCVLLVHSCFWCTTAGEISEILLLQEVFATGFAFAALKKDGSVVTWGATRLPENGMYGAGPRVRPWFVTLQL